MANESSTRTRGTYMERVQTSLINNRDAFERALDQIFPDGYEIQDYSLVIAVEEGVDEAERTTTVTVLVVSIFPFPETLTRQGLIVDEGLTLQEYLQRQGVILS
jgi:hypothetical protein